MIERGAKRGRAAPRLDLSGAEWKLTTAAWLAVVYVASWFAIRPADGGGSGAQSGLTPPGPAASPARLQSAAPRPARIRTRSS